MLLHYQPSQWARIFGSLTVAKEEHFCKTHFFIFDFFKHVEFYRVTEHFNGYFNHESILAYALVPLHASFVR